MQMNNALDFYCEESGYEIRKGFSVGMADQFFNHQPFPLFHGKRNSFSFLLSR